MSSTMESERNHMKSLLSVLLVTLVCLRSMPSESLASELLTSFALHNGGGMSPCELAPVEFYIGIDGVYSFERIYS